MTSRVSPDDRRATRDAGDLPAPRPDAGIDASPPAHWPRLVRLLHWGMAVLLVVQVAAIAWAKSLALGPERTGLVRFHKSLGVTIFVLALVRVLARAAVRAPGLPPGMPAWERLAARASHACLYLLLFLLPLSGWLMSGAGGRPVSWFGWITIPSPVAESPGVRDFLVALHVALAVLLGTVLLAHVAAALRHHFVLRDDVLQRMLGSRRTRGDG